MEVRRTSVEAYQQIEAEGLLSPMRFVVYSVLSRIGPATAGEISQALSISGASNGGGRAGPGNVSARLVELRDLGVAREMGERECKVTSRNVILWDVTDQLPSGRVKQADGPVRPRAEVMRNATIELDALAVFALDAGYVPKDRESLTALLRWLREKFIEE